MELQVDLQNMMLSKIVSSTSASARVARTRAVAKALLWCEGSRGWDWYYNYKEKEAQGPVEAVPFPENTSSSARKKAFLDIKIAEEDKGRVVIELANDLVPTMSQNFLDLCNGVTVENGGGEAVNLTYKGTNFHTIRKGYIIQGGDVDGRGGRCAPQHATDSSGYFFETKTSIFLTRFLAL